MFWPSVAHASAFTPPQVSEIGAHFDTLYAFLLWACFISSILVIGGFIYFAFKYRRKSEQDKTAYIPHNGTLEFLWSFIPFVAFMVMFAWGWYLYYEMRDMPEKGLEVAVTGQKWNWTFQYKSGKNSGELYVPVNTPVKLVMSSRDVLHSFFVPAFRVKQDVVPGQYTALWFEANKVGDFHVFCTEYCGDGHSDMLTKVHVLPKKAYEEWLQKQPYKGLSPLEIGQKVYSNKCAVCHLTSKQKKIGPGFAGLWQNQRKFDDGSTTVADENYIRDSILNPQAQIVKGYPGAMPSFQGQLSENEIRGMIEYIKSLEK